MNSRQESKNNVKEQQNIFPEIIPAPAAKYEPFPLTDIQEAYWIGRSGIVELGDVSTHRYLEIDCEDIDLKKLNDAWNNLIDRHDMMRVIILPTGMQQFLKKVPAYKIRIEDLTGKNENEIQSRLDMVRKEMSHQVLPTDRWPFFEIRATILDVRRTRLHFSFDRLMMDGKGQSLIFREWHRLYQDINAELPSQELSFRDYVISEQQLKQSDIYKKAWAYWEDRLSTLQPGPKLPLAGDFRSISPQFTTHVSSLNAHAWGRLKDRAARQGIKPTAFLLTVFSKVLQIWSASPELTVNLTLFNRMARDSRLQCVVGDYTSSLLLGIDSDGNNSFTDFAQDIQRQLREDLKHSHVSGVSVIREMIKKKGQKLHAVMPVVFTSLISGDVSARRASASSWLGRETYNISQTPQVWIDHHVDEQDSELHYDWDVRDGIFPAGLIEAMFDCYCRLLDILADDSVWEKNHSEILNTLLSAKQHDLLNTVQTQKTVYEDEISRRPVFPEQKAYDDYSDIESFPYTIRITGIVAKILDVADIDIRENLLNIGATSIHMIRIVNLLENELNFRPGIDEFYNDPTIAGLAVAYRQHLADGRIIVTAEESIETTEKNSLSGFNLILDPDERDRFKENQPGIRQEEGRISIALDAAEINNDIERKFLRRRSHRTFLPDPVSFDQFSLLLGCLRRISINGKPKYQYGSAGGLYPVQTYFYIKPDRVKGIKGGIYYYHPEAHQLLLISGDIYIGREIYDPIVNRPIFDAAAFAIFLISDLAAIGPMYGDRSLHYSRIEAGLMAQFMETEAPDADIGLCQIGTLNFDSIRHYFDLSETHVLVHSMLGGLIDTPASQDWLPISEGYCGGEEEREEGEI